MTVAKRFRVLLEPVNRTQAASITIPFDVQEVFGSRGRVAVRGTINGFPFRSSVFPRSGVGKHYMVVNREMREGAKVSAGDTASVVMERDDEPRVIKAPADLARALKANKKAQAAWERLSPSHRKEYVRAIEGAKKPETRARRIERAVAELLSGDEARDKQE
jgi:hypothetical protein